MTGIAAKPVTAEGGRSTVTTSGWRRLLAMVSVASIIAFLAVALVLRDPEAAVYAGGFAVGLVLLRVRRGRLGEVALSLLNLNVLAWMALGAVSNIRGGQGVVTVAIPAALASLALAGLVAVVGGLATRSAPAPRTSPPVAVVAVAAGVFAALVVAGALASDGEGAAVGEGLVVDTSNLRFTPTTLEADAGEITLSVTNGDLFWHTFTIDELAVDVPVAVGARRQAVFEAPPGEYDYYCRIPGHEVLMQGTLIVRAAGS